MVEAAAFTAIPGFLTVTLQVTLHFPAVAVITAVPAFFAVTTPLESTVATFLLFVAYFTVPPSADVALSVYFAGVPPAYTVTAVLLIVIAFFTVIMVPVVLTSLFILLLGRYQISSIEKTYGLTGTTLEVLTNPVQVLGQLTVEPCHQLKATALTEPDKLEDATYLAEFNDMLADKKSCLIVRKDDTITYMGEKVQSLDGVLSKLPPYGNTETTSDAGLYYGGDVQILVKQIDFQYTDGTDGSAFIVTDVGDMIPEIREFAVDVLVVIALVLIFTAAMLVLWIYRTVMQPLGRMQQAAQNIK